MPDCLPCLCKHRSKDVHTGCPLAACWFDSKHVIRQCLIDDNFWQPYIADVLARRQYKGGATLDFQALPSLLCLLENLVFHNTMVEIVGETFLIEAHLPRESEKNVAHADTATLGEEGHPDGPVEFISEQQALTLCAFDSLKSRPHRDWPLTFWP